MSADGRVSARRESPRRLDGVFDRLRTKPLGLVVFVASAAALVLLTQHNTSTIHAPAVGFAQPVEHTTDLVSENALSVEEVHVEIGDEVANGAPLVTLSSRFLKRELALVDAEIAMIEAQARVDVGAVAAEEQEREIELRTDAAQARRDLALARAEASRQSRLASGAASQADSVASQVKAGVSTVDVLREAQWTVEDERSGAEQAAAAARAAGALHGDLQNAAKNLGEQSSLVEPMQRAKEAEIALLQVRRQGLLEDLERLTVHSRISGRVKTVLHVGAAVEPEISVAVVVPLVATEIVAYVPPEKSMVGITEGTIVHVASACSGDAKVLRFGGAVVEAPGQLTNLLGRAFSSRALYGMPLRVSIPEGCSYGVGEALTVDVPERPR
jgi:multidrug resistance efflux pump